MVVLRKDIDDNILSTVFNWCIHENKGEYNK